MAALTTHDAFRRQLNSSFRVHYAPEHSCALVLVQVSDLTSSAHGETFSILLRGPLTPQLPQSLYKFDHVEMGELDLFIVPVERDQNGLYYEAVFNSVSTRK